MQHHLRRVEHFLLHHSEASLLTVPGSGGLQSTITQSGPGTQPQLGADVRELSVLVENITPYILHAKIGAKGRWEVPRKLFNAPNITCALSSQAIGAPSLAAVFSLMMCLTLQTVCDGVAVG